MSEIEFLMFKKVEKALDLGGLPLCFTQFSGERLPISFTLSLTDIYLIFNTQILF